MIASRRGRVDLVKLLLSYESTNVDIADKVGVACLLLYLPSYMLLCDTHIHV